MKLTVLGTSPSFPNPGEASSGYLVRSRDTAILADCGHGVAPQLLTVCDPTDLSAVLISHMHADHFLDLVPLGYALRFRYQRDRPLPLWLPPGGQSVIDRLTGAIDLDPDFWDDWYEIHEYHPEQTLRVCTISIGFAATHHFIPAYAMRFTAEEAGSIVYSSDTARSESVEVLLDGAALALIEATETAYPEEPGDRGHSTGTVAGEMAQAANVRRLLLVHYADSLAEQVLKQAAAVFSGSVELARPGATYCP